MKDRSLVYRLTTGQSFTDLNNIVILLLVIVVIHSIVSFILLMVLCQDQESIRAIEEYNVRYLS